MDRVEVMMLEAGIDARREGRDAIAFAVDQTPGHVTVAGGWIWWHVPAWDTSPEILDSEHAVAEMIATLTFVPGDA